MLSGRGVDQLRSDAHLIVCFTHAPFQDISHPYLSTHVLHLHRFALVGERRVTGDDEKAGDLGEVGIDVFGDPIAEVLLFGIVAHVVEGQDDNGRFVGQGQRLGLGARGWVLGRRTEK